MSHFSVLVIGENVEEQLAPYHEFECTGDNNQYVQDFNETEEILKNYNDEAKTRTMMKHLETGQLFGAYGNQFYRDPKPDEHIDRFSGSGRSTDTNGNWFSYESRDWGDGLGYRPKVHYTPEGYVKVEVPYNQVMSLREYVEEWEGHKVVGKYDTVDMDGDHKYGWARFDVDGSLIEVVRRTNPNRKWDWWEVGGRWSGFFALKADAADQSTLNPSWGWGEDDLREIRTTNRSDSALKKYIDFERMRDIDGAQAARKYDIVYEGLLKNGVEYVSWETMRERYADDIEKAREEYRAQPCLGVFENIGEKNEFLFDDLDRYLVSREEFIQTARNKAVSTFAVVKDGVWYEKGEMGWFGMSTEKVSQEDWNTFVWETIQSLDDDTLLTLVDCHI